MLVGEAAYARWIRSDLTERGSLNCLFEPFNTDFMEYRESQE
jgi:hypothetical protein